MTQHLITIGNGSLNVIDEGQGNPTLVFLHYWGGSARTYDPLIMRLSPGHRCIAFDQRGWGGSSREGDFSLASYAADTTELIRALRLERFVLVGHSMGGKISQMIAMQKPDGLEGLVLVAPAPATALAVPEAQRNAMLQSYGSAEGVKAALGILTRKPLSEDLRRQVTDDTLTGAEGAKVAWTSQGMVEDVTSAGAEIHVPTLVIVGEADTVEPADRLRHEIPKVIPKAEFQVLPGLGHLAPLEGPDEVAEAIKGFVARF